VIQKGNKFNRAVCLLLTVILLVFYGNSSIKTYAGNVSEIANTPQLQSYFGLTQDFTVTDPIFGSSPWRYMYQVLGSDAYEYMQYDSGNYKGWRGVLGKYSHGGIKDSGLSPGAAADAVLVFVAPYTGQLIIEQASISVPPVGSDGVNVKILKENTQLWPQSGWHIVQRNAPATAPQTAIFVKRGDTLKFIANKGSNTGGTNDFVSWAPSLKYIFAMNDFQYSYGEFGLTEVAYKMTNFEIADLFEPTIITALYDYDQSKAHLKAIDIIKETQFAQNGSYSIKTDLCHLDNLIEPEIKLFLWDNLSDLKPLGDSINIPQAADLPTIINIADFGAVPNDDLCDIQAINDAINAAKNEKSAIITFEAGIYNLKVASGQDTAINLSNASNITLQGQKSSDRQPATTLLMNLELANDIEGSRHIFIRNCENIKLKNIVMDHYPRTNSAAEIVEVDKTSDKVVVDILPEMPHFDGMRCYSSNSWDLETKDLLHVAALTIGVDKEKFNNLWQHIPGGDGRRYKIEGLDIASKVEVGQGISWHFNVDALNNIRIVLSKNISMENVFIYNSLGASIAAVDNENLAFKSVHIAPQGNSLAVSPRDGIHMPRNTGRLIMDDIYIKGVRWDPIVCYLQFIKVAQVINGNSISFTTNLSNSEFKPGQKFIFWVGDAPYEAVIQSVQKTSGGVFQATFTEQLPEEVVIDAAFTPEIWNWNDAVIKNSLFEGNYGTPIVYETDNLLIENNVFRNNAYSNIELGPTSDGAGGFARNIIIRNNLFAKSTWSLKSAAQGKTNYGCITTFNKNSNFTTEAYNSNIVIENNVFKDLDISDSAAAIHLKNAQNVRLEGNSYINVKSNLIIDYLSTINIINNEGEN